MELNMEHYNIGKLHHFIVCGNGSWLHFILFGLK